MKSILKFALITIFVLSIFACEDTTTDTADIIVQNLSSNPANVYIHNSGSSSYITDVVPAGGSKTITVEDGAAGLNVNGGRAVVDYRHVISSEEVYETSFVYADLSTTTAAFVTIDNVYGCLDIESYSQNADMWVSIDGGANEVIPAWGDLTHFYDPWGVSVTKDIDYNGYTLFAGYTTMTVVEDSYSRLDIYPDAGCIWINNESSTFYITEVYLSPSYESTWGGNDLYSDIAPYEYYTWSCTPDIYWDIKIIDNWDDEFTRFDIFLSADDVYEINYDGINPIRKNLNADEDKLNNSLGKEITVSNPRVEANNFTIDEITIIHNH